MNLTIIEPRHVAQINKRVQMMAESLETHIEEHILPLVTDPSLKFTYSKNGAVTNIHVDKLSDELVAAMEFFNRNFVPYANIARYDADESGKVIETPLHALIKIQPIAVPKDTIQFAQIIKDCSNNGKIVIVDGKSESGKALIHYSHSAGGYFHQKELRPMVAICSDGAKTMTLDQLKKVKLFETGNISFTDQYDAIVAINSDDILFVNSDDIGQINDGDDDSLIYPHQDAIIINKKSLKVRGANVLKNGDYGIGCVISEENEQYTGYASKDHWIRVVNVKQ